MSQNNGCIHFVGFRKHEYISAVRVWGLPDMIHLIHDTMMYAEIGENDTVIFANGFENKKSSRNWNVSEIM